LALGEETGRFRALLGAADQTAIFASCSESISAALSGRRRVPLSVCRCACGCCALQFWGGAKRTSRFGLAAGRGFLGRCAFALGGFALRIVLLLGDIWRSRHALSGRNGLLNDLVAVRCAVRSCGLGLSRWHPVGRRMVYRKCLQLCPRSKTKSLACDF
jgi:hypothetical protein